MTEFLGQIPTNQVLDNIVSSLKLFTALFKQVQADSEPNPRK